MSRIRKIIFIKDTLFTGRDFERFGIDLLRHNGFSVAIWEITPVLHREILDQIDTSARLKDEDFSLFHDMETLLGAIAALDNTTIVHVYIPLTWQSLPIFRALANNQVPTSTTSLGAVPVPKVYETTSRISRMHGKLKSLFQYSPKRTFFTGINRLLLKHFRLAGVRPLDICVIGGTKSKAHLQLPAAPTTQFVPAHSFDYDTYLTLRDTASPQAPAYGVFIDQNMPFHPEHLYCNIAQVCTPEDYYPALASFFSIVERECQCRIVIAAHPTADYRGHPEYFDGREVIYGKTAELIRNAAVVLTHGSTALNYALFFKKPLVILTTDALERSIIQQDIEMIAELLGKKPVNVSKAREFDCTGGMAIDKAAYDRYISDYIKTKDSPDLPLWQIYADAVKDWEPVKDGV